MLPPPYQQGSRYQSDAAESASLVQYTSQRMEHTGGGLSPRHRVARIPADQSSQPFTRSLSLSASPSLLASADSRRTMSAVIDIIGEIDNEFFAGAKGDTLLAKDAIAKMSPDRKNSVLLLMYQLIHESSDAFTSARTKSFSSISESCSPHDREISRPGGGGLPGFGVHLTSSGEAYMASRTPSMHSFGGASLMSLHRPAVQLTADYHKSMDAESGNKKINEFIVLGDLGKGSQGKVKLAFDSERNVLRAIKVIRRPAAVQGHSVGGKLAPTEQRKRIEQEIAITKRLRHKNLVSLYEVIDDPDHNKLYLVFQHVANGPLTKMRGGVFCDCFDEATCAGFARQLSAGLSYLHQHGVVHRDVKPENILRGDGDEIFLVDFGVSEMLNCEEVDDDEEAAAEKWSHRRRDMRDQQLTVKGCRGTPAFIAPELIMLSSDKGKQGEKEKCAEQSGGQVDVWALGVTLFAVLCGRLPWVVEDTTLPDDDPERFAFRIRQYFHCVCSDPPMFPPLQTLVRQRESLQHMFQFSEREEPLPKQWADLLEAMLRKDPAQRPTISAVRRRVKALRGPVGVGFRRPSLEPVPSISSVGTAANASAELALSTVTGALIQDNESAVSQDCSGEVSQETSLVSESTSSKCNAPEKRLPTNLDAVLASVPSVGGDIQLAGSPVLAPNPPSGDPQESPSFALRPRRRTRQWVEE